VVVVGVNGKVAGLAVDNVSEKRKFSQALNKYFKNSRYTSGTTIVEDCVIPILDMNSIVNSISSTGTGE